MSEVLMHELAVKDRVVLGGPLTVRSIAVAHGRIGSALMQYPAVTIDCAGATEVDLSFIQLVLSARRSAIAAGKTVSLAQPAAGALHEALLLAGLIAPAGRPPAADQMFWLS